MIEPSAIIPLTPNTIDQADMLATRLSKSAIIPAPLRGKPADVLVILMTGSELGLSPMQALRGISVIEGKPVLDAALIVALIVKRRDICRYFRLVESTDTSATYETHREGAPEPVRLTYTIEQAQKAKLTGKDNWQKHPADMLRWRCSAKLGRAVYADLVLGLYTPDEGDEIRERVLNEAPPPPPASPPAANTDAQAERPAPPRAQTVDVPRSTQPGPLEQVLILIAESQTVANLDGLTKRAQALPEPDRTTARAAWIARRKEIANAKPAQ